jgi:hypothetical protein
MIVYVDCDGIINQVAFYVERCTAIRVCYEGLDLISTEQGTILDFFRKKGYYLDEYEGDCHYTVIKELGVMLGHSEEDFISNRYGEEIGWQAAQIIRRPYDLILNYKAPLIKIFLQSRKGLERY